MTSVLKNINNNSSAKRTALASLAVIFLFVLIAAPIHEAHAITSIKIAGIDLPFQVIDAVQTTLGKIGTFLNVDSNRLLVIKQYILIPLARIIIGMLIRAMTNQILGWIQGGNTGFVQNLDQEFRRTADEAGGEFLNNISGINMCGNLNAFLRITLTVPSARRPRYFCTVTQIVSNLQSFARNFQRGGWPAFFKLQLVAQNGPAGAFMIGLDDKIAYENNRRENKARVYQANRGFLGFRVPVQKNCEVIQRPSNTSGSNGEGSIAFSGDTNSAQAPDEKLGYLEGQPITFNSPGFASVLGPLAVGDTTQGITAPNTSNNIVPSANNTATGPSLPGIFPSQATPTDNVIGGADSQIPSAASVQQQQQAQQHAVFQQGADILPEDTSTGGPSLAGPGQTNTVNNGDRTVNCQTEYEVKTPGQTVAFLLNKSVGSGFDFSIAGQDIDSVISAIATALIQKIIGSSFLAISGNGGSNGNGGGNVSGQGIFDPGASTLAPLGANDVQNSNLVGQIDNAISKTDKEIQALDQTLVPKHQHLITTYVRINSSQLQIQNLTTQVPNASDQISGLQSQVTTLRQDAANTENIMTPLVSGKLKMLAAKSAVLSAKRSLTNGADTSQFIAASHDIPGTILGINSVIDQVNANSVTAGIIQQNTVSSNPSDALGAINIGNNFNQLLSLAQVGTGNPKKDNLATLDDELINLDNLQTMLNESIAAYDHIIPNSRDVNRQNADIISSNFQNLSNRVRSLKNNISAASGAELTDLIQQATTLHTTINQTLTDGTNVLNALDAAMGTLTTGGSALQPVGVPVVNLPPSSTNTTTTPLDLNSILQSLTAPTAR